MEKEATATCDCSVTESFQGHIAELNSKLREIFGNLDSYDLDLASFLDELERCENVEYKDVDNVFQKHFKALFKGKNEKAYQFKNSCLETVMEIEQVYGMGGLSPQARYRVLIDFLVSGDWKD